MENNFQGDMRINKYIQYRQLKWGGNWKEEIFEKAIEINFPEWKKKTSDSKGQTE